MAQSLSVLSENRGRGRGTRGVLDWPYPTVLDLPTPGQSSRSDEEMMRSDYMASHGYRINPTPTGESNISLTILTRENFLKISFKKLISLTRSGCNNHLHGILCTPQ